MSIDPAVVNTQLTTISEDISQSIQNSGFGASTISSIFGVSSSVLEYGQTIDGIRGVSRDFDSDFSMNGFQFSLATIVDSDLSEVVQDDLIFATPSIQTSSLVSLEGNINSTGDSAETGVLAETITLGSPAAINYTLQRFTERTSTELSGVLSNLSINPSFSIDTLTNFDFNLSGTISELTSSLTQFESMLGSIESTIRSVAPQIANGLLDDIILNSSTEIRDTLYGLIGTNIIPGDLRASVVRDLFNGDVESAVNTVLENTTLSLTVEEIEEALSNIDLSTNVGSYGLPDIELGSLEFDYVDTAEEFEGDLFSSPRDFSRIIMGGASISGDRLTGSRITPGQSSSFREIMRAFHRVIPGGQLATFAQIQSIVNGGAISNVFNQISTPSFGEISTAPGFIPGDADCAVTGRSLATPYVSNGTIIPPTGGASAPGNGSLGGTENLVTITTSIRGLTAQVSRLYAENFQGFIDELEGTYDYEIRRIGGYANRPIILTNM